MKRVGILQPGYLPWLGFFELMASSDIFVIYDDVQYDKHGWRNRNRIKTAAGIQWLTVPVFTKGKNRPKVNEILIANDRWKRKHLQNVSHAYGRAKYFDDIFPILQKGIQFDTDKLIDVDMFFIREFAGYMGIETELFLSSSLNIYSDEKSARLISICKHFGATHYYNGARGRHLYRKEDFAKEGLILEIQNYIHPEYSQLHGDFIPYMSIVDLLFNMGRSSLEIVLSGKSVI